MKNFLAGMAIILFPLFLSPLALANELDYESYGENLPHLTPDQASYAIEQEKKDLADLEAQINSEEEKLQAMLSAYGGVPPEENVHSKLVASLE